MIGRIVSLVMIVAVLSGCVSPIGPLPAETDISGRVCADRYLLSNARAVVFDPQGSSETVSVDVAIGPNSPCFQAADGTRRTYAVFDVSGIVGQDVTLVAGSRVEPGRLLPPTALVLDHGGDALLEFGAGRFLFRGDHLSVSFRARAGFRYVVVASDPDRVGGQFTKVDSMVSGAVIPIGPAVTYVPVSADTTNTLHYSHYGVARLRAFVTPVAGEQ